MLRDIVRKTNSACCMAVIHRDIVNAQSTIIFSDCKLLVEAIKNKSVEDIPSWKAIETVLECVTA